MFYSILLSKEFRQITRQWHKINRYYSPFKNISITAQGETMPKKTQPLSTNKKKKIKAITKKMTKAELFTELANRCDLEKKQIKTVFDSLSDIITGHILPRSCGEITLPIGVKIKRVERKAQKARVGRNPLTGEEVKIARKPKTNVIKVSVLKALKIILQK